MDFDKDMWDIINKMSNGTLKVPDYIAQHNPPTLWTYYSTLPSWARNDPVVRNVMMACEYHQPLMSIRQKENALNLACSFLRPMDPTLKLVIADAILSTKKKLNMKSGQQMLNDLAFYELDIDYLGDVSDDEGGTGQTEEQVLNEKEKLLKMSL